MALIADQARTPKGADIGTEEEIIEVVPVTAPVEPATPAPAAPVEPAKEPQPA